MMKSIGMGGLIAPMAGLESALTGTAQAVMAPFGKELATTPLQTASQEARKDLGFVPGALYDMAYTAGNMAPSIALSAGLGGLGVAPKLAGALGSISLGASSSGNAYKQALEMGYTQEQALGLRITHRRVRRRDYSI